MAEALDLDRARSLLCALGDHIRDTAIEARAENSQQELAEIAAVTSADTIYRIDKITEDAVEVWFKEHWPADAPVEIVMEGIEDSDPWSFPAATPLQETLWKCIIDPIDGTRGLMYDKRPAWALAALAPQPAASLADLSVAAMTEIPTVKQWRADQLSAVRGRGPEGVVAEAVEVRDNSRKPLAPRPSQAGDLRHGFASFARFFPQGKALTARIEEDLLSALDEQPGSSPLVFEDQYISTGGQLYELAVGHDRMLGDLRPLVHRKLGIDSSLTCHPYDIATALVLTELGGIVEDPWGAPIESPLDTTSPVAWVGYANDRLAAAVRPVLHRVLERHLGGWP